MSTSVTDTSFPPAAPRAPGSFSGRRVAVTGGTSGLGLALVHTLLERGAEVALVARTAPAVQRVAASHRRAHGVVGDVSDERDIARIALEILGALGGLDILVNNASSLGPTPLALLADTENEDFERALATNLLGPFRLTRALLGALASSARSGRCAVVVNVSSDAAREPYPLWGAYGASKAALHHMSSIWRQELAAEGIAVLSIDPGDMDTPLHAAAVPNADVSRLRRPGDAAQDVAEALESALRGRAEARPPAAGEATS